MDVQGEPFDRRLSRADMLRLAALAAGAGVVAGPAAAADAAVARLTKETGRLQVMDWAGYDNTMPHHAMFAEYVRKHPHNKPVFINMTSEANALGKLRNGVHPDLFRPYVGWVKYFAENGYVQPWNPRLISNFKHLNKFMVKAGQYKGKQYGIPDDWGFDAILYRKDKVHPKARSWSLLWDERYKGKIAWFDDPVEMFIATGWYFGFKNPYKMSDAQLEHCKNFLISKKHLVREIWSSETTLDTDFASGDIWIAYAWPNDWVLMKAKKLPVVYMHPKEKPIAWVGMFMLLKDTPRFHLAHAYVDAWSSKRSGQWLENNYGYGHANVLAKPSSSQLLKALQLNNPRAVTEPYAHLDRDVPRRAVYAQAWAEVVA
jgi:spermidine/putrescine transport system substrate-binding protein